MLAQLIVPVILVLSGSCIWFDWFFVCTTQVKLLIAWSLSLSSVFLFFAVVDPIKAQST